MRIASAHRTVADFHRSIADPDIFCGGGSVAAISAAGAASTALLVMRLNLNRRTNQEHRPAIEAAIYRTETIVESFHRLADADIETLDALLAAQRSAKNGSDTERDAYLSALADAARSPLAIGDASVELLVLIDGELDRAARFTISDLGAAASLIEGSCRAAFITAEVNIALLRDACSSDSSIPDEIDRRRGDLLKEIMRLTEVIETRTRSRIHQPRRRTS